MFNSTKRLLKFPFIFLINFTFLLFANCGYSNVFHSKNIASNDYFNKINQHQELSLKIELLDQNFCFGQTTYKTDVMLIDYHSMRSQKILHITDELTNSKLFNN
ncbi:hypothetical protein SAMN05444396_102333 [Flavobacterium segetis]|uniref:Uncharacterized protein n=1 Tax=Flavobacterium segetis TaxID=271157 RepID=A0A1M5FFF0_9FLAO|nr:hypothetical protein SAMN05444396_102333 [Flavobacterium segetis]